MPKLTHTALFAGTVALAMIPGPVHAGGHSGTPFPFGGSTKDDFWHQNRDEVPGEPEDLELYGWAVATCDFNGDGYQDLAVGAPGEEQDGAAFAGVVLVQYGSAEGLTGVGAQVFSHAHPALPAWPTVNERFGHALAAADFDVDGRCDLAIGSRVTPTEAGRPSRAAFTCSTATT